MGEHMDAISVMKTGVTLATSGTSANVAIPTDSSGAAPKYIRVAATQDCYIKLGPSGVAAVAGDMLLQVGDSVVLATSFAPYIAALQVSAAGVLQVSPLEG